MGSNREGFFIGGFHLEVSNDNSLTPSVISAILCQNVRLGKKIQPISALKRRPSQRGVKLPANRRARIDYNLARQILNNCRPKAVRIAIFKVVNYFGEC
jgi:hypothetical protein